MYELFVSPNIISKPVKEVIYFYSGKNGINGVVKGSSTGIHTPSITNNGEFNCTCQGFQFQGRRVFCSHLYALCIEGEKQIGKEKVYMLLKAIIDNRGKNIGNS